MPTELELGAVAVGHLSHWGGEGSSYSTLSPLEVANYNAGGSPHKVTLVRFDLTDVPAGATIEAATLRIFWGYVASPGYNRIYARAVKAANPWVHGECCYNFPYTGGYWAGDVGQDYGDDAGCRTEGVDYDTGDAIASTVIPSTGFQDFELTAAGVASAQAWADGGDNNGLMLRSAVTDFVGGGRLVTLAGADSAQHPRFIVSYSAGGSGSAYPPIVAPRRAIVGGRPRMIVGAPL